MINRHSDIVFRIKILGGSDTNGLIYGVTPPSTIVVFLKMGHSSSSASTANLMCRAVSRLNPFLEHISPESSSISAQMYSNAAAMNTGAQADTF